MIITLILVAIIGICLLLSKKQPTQKLVQIYNQIKEEQPYYFEMEKNDKNKVIMAQKDNKIMIDQYSENNHSTTIVKDNNTYYYILHNREEYYVYEQNNIKQNILPDGFKEIIAKPFETGTEKIKGKKYSYEEYSGSTMFIITNDLDLNEENIKTRFFFDNDGNLVYIKTMTNNDQELLKVNFTKEVNEELFEVPSHYAEY